MSNRVPNKSQIGHLILKSSAYAPTAMSYMGQDLIKNHMQSHYQRISSAKASVDTSPPKSMKMHMRVRDQKQKSLNRRDMGLLSARSNTSNASQQHTGQHLSRRSSSVNNLASSRHARRSPRDEQNPRTSTPLDSSKRPQSTQVDHRSQSSRLTDYDSRRQNNRELIRNMPTKEKPHGLFQLLVADDEWDKKQPRSPRNSSKFDSTTDPHRPLHQKEVKHRQGHESNLDNYNFMLDLPEASDEEYLNDNMGNTSRRELPSGLKNSRLYESADLDQEELAFSYKSPPSSRREPNAVSIWILMEDQPERLFLFETYRGRRRVREEEQLYLRFISDVTTDILARGVFSNRVLQQVFDSHIERRKHQLDEERMREMIDQLKEDLSITDFPSQS